MIDDVVLRIHQLRDANQPLPWGALSALLAALQSGARDQAEVDELYAAIRSGQAPPETAADIAGLLRRLIQKVEAPRPCRPADLDALAADVAAALDPTADDASARTRVVQQFPGLDPERPTAPPEMCPRVDLPTWSALNQMSPDWLLPGIGTIPQDRVISMQTNSGFVDAFLLGLNTQLLEELRWRNVPAPTGCTPARVFWDQIDTASEGHVDDIRPVGKWESETRLGAGQHQPKGGSGSELVLVFRGQLFLRYPQTLLYLISADHDGTSDFDRDPELDAPRLLPSFQGRIGADVTFFGFQGLAPADVGSYWIALEEPPAGYRFYSNVAVAVAGPPAGYRFDSNGAVAVAVDGAEFADRTFANPVRVLIAGSALSENVENLLRNADFALARPVPPPPLMGSGTGGLAAAEDWTTWNNSSAITVTDLQLTTRPGGAGRMLHLTTTAGSCGLVQQWAPNDTGPSKALASAWIYVVRGTVGLGSGNGGATGIDVVNTTLGQWELLQAASGRSPVNELIIYATADGGAEFYIDSAGLLPPEPATFVSQSVPASVQAGQPFQVTVTMRNTGIETWTLEGHYRLGSQNPQDNLTWSVDRIAVPGPIAPGEDAVFQFQVTAPANPGTTDFQWRMVQGEISWFGQVTPNIPIVVREQ